MFTKTNLMAVAIVAAAAFTASPSANASVAAGMSSAAGFAATTSAAPAAQGNVVLAHGRRLRHRHLHFGWGGGPYWIDYGYGYRNCRWLKRKARRTGRRYWWNRYHRCMNAF